MAPQPGNRNARYPMTDPDELVQIQVRLPRSLRMRLADEADRRMVAKALLVERALAEALDRWEREPIAS